MFSNDLPPGMKSTGMAPGVMKSDPPRPLTLETDSYKASHFEQLPVDPDQKFFIVPRKVREPFPAWLAFVFGACVGQLIGALAVLQYLGYLW